MITLMYEEMRVLQARIIQAEVMFEEVRSLRKAVTQLQNDLQAEKVLAEHYRDQFRQHKQRANH